MVILTEGRFFILMDQEVPGLSTPADQTILTELEILYISTNRPARDDIIINFCWKFDIKEIQTRFDIWQGDKDKNVPLNQGQYQADLLPNSRFQLLKDKGYMLLLDKWKNILAELVN